MISVINLVRANLGGYTYPAFRIIRATNGPLEFGDGVTGKLCPDTAPTDAALDEYHRELLLDLSPSLNLLGLASIVYWGYARSGYRDRRVERVIAGVTSEKAGIVISAMRLDIQDKKHLGCALARLDGVAELGRTPFASKVVAFLCPHAAGVYDNKIARALNDHPALMDCAALQQARNGVGPVRSRTTQERYQAWCDVLQEIAATIGPRNPLGRPVRAIDVERAIFSMANNATVRR